MVALKILAVLFFAIFLCYQIYALVRDIIAKKKKKKPPEDKGDDK